MSEPAEIEQPIQLLVEGKDPKNFFAELARHTLLDSMQIQNFGGVNEFRNFIGQFVKAPRYETVKSIGVVRDAERCAKSAFQSIQGALRAAGLDPPDVPGERTDGTPNITVWILPGDERDGMLETLLAESIADDATNNCIDQFLSCATDSGQAISRPDKARVHAYLATREHPQVSVGVAAQRKYWNLDHKVFHPTRDVLKIIALADGQMEVETRI